MSKSSILKTLLFRALSNSVLRIGAILFIYFSSLISNSTCVTCVSIASSSFIASIADFTRDFGSSTNSGMKIAGYSRSTGGDWMATSTRVFFLIFISAGAVSLGFLRKAIQRQKAKRKRKMTMNITIAIVKAVLPLIEIIVPFLSHLISSVFSVFVSSTLFLNGLSYSIILKGSWPSYVF